MPDTPDILTFTFTNDPSDYAWPHVALYMKGTTLTAHTAVPTDSLPLDRLQKGLDQIVGPITWGARLEHPDRQHPVTDVWGHRDIASDSIPRAYPASPYPGNTLAPRLPNLPLTQYPSGSTIPL